MLACADLRSRSAEGRPSPRRAKGLEFRLRGRLLLRHLKSLGYEATFHDLPDSTHNALSEEAVQVAVDAILQST